MFCALLGQDIRWAFTGPMVLWHFNYQSEWIVGTLCAHLLLQFYIDSFETSQVFWTWSEHMHVVWIYSSDNFYHFFH